ncbi:MAG: hypothetical protein ACRDMV_20250 [Streptosporangiales bacterium]
MSYLDDLPAHGEEPWDSQLVTALGDINAAAETAQSTADGKVSPGDLAPVATSGAYSDLSGTPAIPDSYDDIGAASAAQGSLADSATQPGDLATVAGTGSYSDLTGRPAIPDSPDDIGAAEEVASPIGWTAVSTQSPITTVHRARIRRHATGQVELQIDADISGFSSGNNVASVPSWAWPTDGESMNFICGSGGNGFCLGRITTGGDVKLFSPSSLNDVQMVVSYTP